mmetsp:Transcript_7517/g.11383  ORF Transcript_7517/g.11383 Transcript_7517/m.11383 type:complete len:336 (-) Transcript_7517:111-1118(-)
MAPIAVFWALALVSSAVSTPHRVNKVSTYGSSHKLLSLQKIRCIKAKYRENGRSVLQAKSQQSDISDGASLFSRRSLLKSTVLGTSAAMIYTPESSAGMVQYPPKYLNNRYLLMRAGEDSLEARNIITTNKVKGDSMEHGLTDEGKRQVVQAFKTISEMTNGDDDIVLWPSIQFNSYQSATILAELMGVGQNRLVPEFTFLDPRGMGTFEGGSLSKYDMVHEKDKKLGILYAPFKNDDGTDNESVNDVYIRVRQAMAITETQFIGKTVVFISPDSDNLSVLEAAISAESTEGLIPSLADHARFSYIHGEVREVGSYATKAKAELISKREAMANSM